MGIDIEANKLRATKAEVVKLLKKNGFRLDSDDHYLYYIEGKSVRGVHAYLGEDGRVVQLSTYMGRSLNESKLQEKMAFLLAEKFNGEVYDPQTDTVIRTNKKVYS